MNVSLVLNILAEFIFALCGVVCMSTAFRGLKNEKARIGTFVFWFLLGLIFIFGGLVNNAAGTLPDKPIPAYVVGIMLVVMAGLSATKQVQISAFTAVDDKEREANSQRIGSKIFIPALAIGVMVLLLSFVKVNAVSGAISISFATPAGKLALPSAFSIGAAGIIACLLGVLIARPKFSETKADVEKLLMQVGPSSTLPQLLSSLGTVFTVAGVGTVISNIMSNVIPSGNYFLGVLFYLLGMVIFTMIMGNAFAAFSVITVGIGIPFVIAQGGDPALVGALALTGGYCGTLITPMAANFNIIPVSILEIKDRYRVIKSQLPVAVIMFVVHVILMYFFTR